MGKLAPRHSSRMLSRSPSTSSSSFDDSARSKKLVGGSCFGSPTMTTCLPRAMAPDRIPDGDLRCLVEHHDVESVGVCAEVLRDRQRAHQQARRQLGQRCRNAGHQRRAAADAASSSSSHDEACPTPSCASRSPAVEGRRTAWRAPRPGSALCTEFPAPGSRRCASHARRPRSCESPVRCPPPHFSHQRL